MNAQVEEYRCQRITRCWVLTLHSLDVLWTEVVDNATSRQHLM